MQTSILLPGPPCVPRKLTSPLTKRSRRKVAAVRERTGRLKVRCAHCPRLWNRETSRARSGRAVPHSRGVPLEGAPKIPLHSTDQRTPGEGIEEVKEKERYAPITRVCGASTALPRQTQPSKDPTLACRPLCYTPLPPTHYTRHGRLTYTHARHRFPWSIRQHVFSISPRVLQVWKHWALRRSVLLVGEALLQLYGGPLLRLGSALTGHRQAARPRVERMPASSHH
jgi:hypothetical protein